MKKKARLTATRFGALSVIASCCLAFIIVFLWYPPELFQLPMQNFDTPAHLYAVEKILNSGLSEVLHLSPSGGFYPPLFHIIAAVFAQFFGLFVGVSIAWIVGAGIVFPVGMYFLTKEVLTLVKSRYKKIVLILAPILAVSFLAFPYSLLDIGTLYAYGFAISLLPWLLYSTKKFWRVLVSSDRQKKQIVAVLSGIILSLVLVMLAQPRVLFLAMPVILVDVIFFIIEQWRIKKKLAISALTVSSSLLLLFIAGIGYYVFRSLRSDLLLHPENWFEGVVPTHSWFEAILSWFGGIPNLFSTYFISALTIIIIIASLVFAIKKWRNEIAQKFLILYSLFGFIYVFCVSSNSGFAKFISAPWYQNGWRILVVIPILVIPIFILFLIKICDKLSKRNMVWSVFLAPVIIISCIMTVLFSTASLQLKSQVVSQAIINSSSLFSQSEYYLSQKLDFVPDSLILADPTTGANYISFFTDYQMVFPVINPDTVSQENLGSIIEAFDTADSKMLQSVVCSYGAPVYFLDLGEQSNIFGGEYILLPWRSFHNQSTIRIFIENNVIENKTSINEYNYYKFVCN